VNVDSAGLEVLSRSDCLALAETVPIGRIVFTDQALPAILPVNFLFDDGCLIIRTADGTKLAAAMRGTIVAFETDDYDAGTESGWSVTVVGRAESVVDAAESARLARLPLRTWAPGHRDRFIRIRPEYVTGRRIPVAKEPNGEGDRLRDQRRSGSASVEIG
jgi:nitroimidazol reductase NimA-like FMN-containing flavoprotein (pyridoxamine 5'-phosphate oxidase superfamily)